MRAMRAERFAGYAALELVDMPKPVATEGKLLIRMTAAGVTPLDHTILSGQFPMSTAPLVLGNEGAGVVEDGDADFPTGARVAFCGTGIFDDGAYSEYVAVNKDALFPVPEAVDDIAAAGLPVAYLTAY